MKENKQKKIVLLDAHAILHRAYHALPDFSNSKGEPTGALYGLTTMLLKIISLFDPEYIIACYDLPQKTFRHLAYDDYKGTRAKTDDALITQLKVSREIFEAFGIPVYDAPGFEADDILGTLAEEFKKHTGYQTIIASGDMDTLQLVVAENVVVFTLKKGITDTIIYTEEEVFKRFGFNPISIPDYKGLRGDPSDNIIGIKGIGEKTATTLIQKYGTIEKMYTVLKKDPQEFKTLGLTDRIVGLLKEGEDEALFSKVLATIRKDAPVDITIPKETFKESFKKDRAETILKKYEFKSILSRIQNISTEEQTDVSHKVEPPKDTISDIGLWYVALSLLDSEKTDWEEKDVYAFGGAHSFEEGIRCIEKTLKERELDFVFETIEKPLYPLVREMEENGIAIDKAYLKKLGTNYHIELKKLTEKIYTLTGETFNINSPKQLGEILYDKLGLLPENKKVVKKTKGGARSTKESELEKLRSFHPVISLLLEYRELQKLLSTYIDILPDLAKEDGRIHSKFNQLGAATGRFSSNEPNLQNIPIKTEKGKVIREGFIAPPGKKLLSFDYSQIELRIAALLSQDSYLLDVFDQKKDIHAAVASRVFKVREEEVTQEMRRRAKIINFGILYGMGVTALQSNLGTSREEAKKFYDEYFAEFPTIQTYLDTVLVDAKRTGYTKTLFGRKRYFKGLRSSIPFMKAMAERMAINAPIQGTAADILKYALIAVDTALKENKLKKHALLILQVHDELVYEVDEEFVEEITAIISSSMKEALPASLVGEKRTVVLDVHASVGNTWGELK